MLNGLNFPIQTLEMDVVVSKDNQVVVSHEPWMNEEICEGEAHQPFHGKEINLFAIPYSEMMKYDCGSKPYPRFPRQVKIKTHKPLLKDLILESEKKIKNLQKSIVYSIEIKSTPVDEATGYQPPYRQFTDLVMKTILEQLPKERVLIQSFDWRVLRYLHRKYPSISTSALYEKSDFSPFKLTLKSVLKELGFTPSVISPDYHELTSKLVHDFQEKGIKVIPWTVNEPSEMKALREMGVDGIITDYPDFITKH